MRGLPEATVRRLPLYLRALDDASQEQPSTVSSDELAARAGVNAAQVRKDLSFIGSVGTRGVGYDIEVLRQHLSRQLGLTHQYRAALVGLGNLGQALVNYRGFRERGFQVVAAFDCDPDKVGQRSVGVYVYPISDLATVVGDQQVTMALIATPAAAAQDVADRLVEAGVRSLLNFAPVVLTVPAHVCARQVDLAVELQILSYYDHVARQHDLAAEPGYDAGDAGGATYPQYGDGERDRGLVVLGQDATSPGGAKMSLVDATPGSLVDATPGPLVDATPGPLVAPS